MTTHDGNIDLEYLRMMMPANSELRKVSGGLNILALVELENGTRLIVKDETEIMIPASMREEMIRILHLTHQADTAMLTQAKQKIFWPGMKNDLQRIYKDCTRCQEAKVSKANEHNEVSQTNIPRSDGRS